MSRSKISVEHVRLTTATAVSSTSTEGRLTFDQHPLISSLLDLIHEP
jgi:hypothetical protein